MSKDFSSIRIRRLMSLLKYLRNKKNFGASLKNIIHDCEYTSIRTLERDIKFLRDEFHAEIICDNSRPKKYYLLNEGNFYLNLDLNQKDIIALVSGLGMAGHFMPGLKNNCLKIWDKICEVLPDNLINFGHDIAESSSVAVQVSGMDSEIFEKVLDAVIKKCAIEFKYKSPIPGHVIKTHKLSAWNIFFKAHSWYLIAGNRDEILNFKIARISELKILFDEEFINPPENYSYENYIKSGWHVVPGEAKYFIKLILSEPIATITNEIKLNPSQKIIKLDSNTAELTANVPDLKEVARWVMSSAPCVKIVEPDELKELVKDLAKNIIIQHSDLL